jgi:hypothetical protein
LKALTGIIVFIINFACPMSSRKKLFCALSIILALWGISIIWNRFNLDKRLFKVAMFVIIVLNLFLFSLKAKNIKPDTTIYDELP